MYAQKSWLKPLAILSHRAVTQMLQTGGMNLDRHMPDAMCYLFCVYCGGDAPLSDMDTAYEWLERSRALRGWNLFPGS